jgi:hypothetical protein
MTHEQRNNYRNEREKKKVAICCISNWKSLIYLYHGRNSVISAYNTDPSSLGSTAMIDLIVPLSFLFSIPQNILLVVKNKLFYLKYVY